MSFLQKYEHKWTIFRTKKTKLKFVHKLIAIWYAPWPQGSWPFNLICDGPQLAGIWMESGAIQSISPIHSSRRCSRWRSYSAWWCWALTRSWCLAVGQELLSKSLLNLILFPSADCEIAGQKLNKGETYKPPDRCIQHTCLGAPRRIQTVM